MQLLNIFYCLYYYKFIIMNLLFILNIFILKTKDNIKEIKPQINRIIKENFFIIDSNNLE